MIDLFTHAEQYPQAPGASSAGTSEDAAKAIKPRINEIHHRILEQLKICTMTTDECADALKETVLMIRPRFTELKEKQLIERTGERRKNSSGQTANVYRIKAQ